MLYKNCLTFRYIDETGELKQGRFFNVTRVWLTDSQETLKDFETNKLYPNHQVASFLSMESSDPLWDGAFVLDGKISIKTPTTDTTKWRGFIGTNE